MPSLNIKKLLGANRDLKRLRDLDASIVFRRPSAKTDPKTYKFSYAAFNTSRSKSLGQSGIIIGIKFGKIYHQIDWIRAKQKRVSHSSYGAEIFACMEADYRGYYIRSAMRSALNNDRADDIFNVN